MKHFVPSLKETEHITDKEVREYWRWHFAGQIYAENYINSEGYAFKDAVANADALIAELLKDTEVK